MILKSYNKGSKTNKDSDPETHQNYSSLKNQAPTRLSKKETIHAKNYQTTWLSSYDKKKNKNLVIE